MRARRDNPTGADPQGAVARAESFGADHYDPLAAAVAEARLVERARIVKWLLGHDPDAADAIDRGDHLTDDGLPVRPVRPARR